MQTIVSQYRWSQWRSLWAVETARLRNSRQLHFFPMFLLITAVWAQACLQTNRLCIEESFLVQQSSIRVYYPTTLIPVDIDPTTLSLNFYQSSTVNDPCNLQSLVKSFPVVPAQADQVTNSTLLKIDVPEGTYVMQLSDPAKRQCLLGPNIRGMYTESVQVRAAASTTTTTTTTIVSSTNGSTVLPTLSKPDPELPLQNSTDQNFTVALIVSLVGLIIIIIGLLFCCLESRKRKQVLREDDVEHAPTLHTRISNSRLFRRTSYSAKKSAIDTEPRASMAVERIDKRL